MTFKRRCQIKNEVVSVGVGGCGCEWRYSNRTRGCGWHCFHHTGCQWEAKERMKAGSLRRMKEGRKKRGFLHLLEGKITWTLSPFSEICKETSLFCISPLCIYQPKSKNFSNVTKWTRYGPVFGAARNSHIPVLTWVPVRKVPTIPTDNVQNWLTPIVEPL